MSGKSKHSGPRSGCKNRPLGAPVIPAAGPTRPGDLSGRSHGREAASCDTVLRLASGVGSLWSGVWRLASGAYGLMSDAKTSGQRPGLPGWQAQKSNERAGLPAISDRRKNKKPPAPTAEGEILSVLMTIEGDDAANANGPVSTARAAIQSRARRHGCRITQSGR